MSGFNVYFSNRTENLIDELALLISRRKSPFENLQIAVQSRGMERYLSLELANRTGIAANLSFPFPSHVWNNLLSILSERNDNRILHFPYNINELRRGIYTILSETVQKDSPWLKNYLRNKDENVVKLKKFQLSQKIAGLYDRYAVQRPDMLRKWLLEDFSSEDEDEIWQRNLYNELLGRNFISDPLQRIKDLNNAAGQKAMEDIIPRRLFFFGISNMPLLYREILEILSGICSIYIFNLSPDADFAKKENKKILPGLRDYLGADSSEYFEYLSNLQLNKNNNAEAASHGDSGEKNNLLYILQQSVSQGRNNKNHSYEEDDFSVTVHSCHSPFREVEVLRNFLIGRLNEDKNLKASDIIVMMKDVDRYAPFIHSIFGFGADGYNFEYSISDRHPSSDFDVWDLLNQFIEILPGKFTSREMISLSENVLIKKHFNFTDDDISLFRELIEGAGIRWGYDGEEKKEYGLSPVETNTWRMGFDRLLLGYLMPGNSRELYQNILPVEALNSGTFENFGKFIDFIETSRNYRKAFSASRTFSEWKSIIQDFFKDMAGIPPDRLDFIKNLDSGDISVNNKTEMFNIDIVSGEINNSFSEKRFAYDFLSGGITFCSLTPMRSVPKKLIAVLGLDESSFPSADTNPSFDLIQKHPVRTDITRKNDDKRLFLEIILSAGEYLFLSYTGKDISNNREIRPSSVITQVLSEIKNTLIEKNDFRKIVFNHHLFQFHPDYFLKTAKSVYSSYSKNEYNKARSLLSDPEDEYSFLPLDYCRNHEEVHELSVPKFIRYFVNPSEYYLKQMSIYPESEQTLLEEDEVFFPTSLENYNTMQEILKIYLSGGNTEESFANLHNILQGSGFIPHENAGKAYLNLKYSEMSEYLTFIKKMIKPSERLPVSLNIKLEKLNLILNANFQMHENELIFFRPASVKPKDLLSAWIYHLILSCPGEKEVRTSLIGLNKGKIEHMRFLPVSGSKNILRMLEKLYFEGLSRPLPFFLNTSHAYAAKYISADDGLKAISEAGNKWNGIPVRNIPGEKDNESINKCFDKASLPDIEGFTGMALEIFKPLIEHIEAVDL